jgi:hypothetical protein
MDTKRGTGRTTRSIQDVLKIALEGVEPRLVVYVQGNSQQDDYCFRIVARLEKSQIKQYSMASRIITFKSGGRIRFVNWDDDQLMEYGPEQWRLIGYRADTPVIWDHHARDLRIEREIARNSPESARKRAKIEEMRKLMEKPKL